MGSLCVDECIFMLFCVLIVGEWDVIDGFLFVDIVVVFGFVLVYV